MAKIFYLIKAILVLIISIVLLDSHGTTVVEDIVEPKIIQIDPNVASINEKINLAKQQPQFDKKILVVAESFIGTPYNSRVLTDDSLTTRIDSLDCWTFVENTVAIALASTSEYGDYNLYKQILIRLRYRNGVNNGYASRIHYFLEWKQNLQKREVASDYSEYYDGIGVKKKLSYISDNAPDSLKQYLRVIEKNLSIDGFYCIPPSTLDESKLMDGDILGFVTSKDELDVEHVAIVKKINDIAYIVHASKNGVCVNDLPLKEYLEQSKTKIGIILLRVYKSNLQ